MYFRYIFGIKTPGIDSEVFMLFNYMLTTILVTIIVIIRTI